MTTSAPEFFSDELEPDQIERLLADKRLTPNEVVEGLWHGQVLVRGNAARGARFVTELPDPGEAMLRISAKDADAGVRHAIVTALSFGLGSHKTALPVLFDALLDSGEGIRDTAMQGLERRLLQDKPNVLPFFAAALSDVRSTVSAAAAQLLVKAGGHAAIPTLVPLLASDDPRPRRAAYDVLDYLKRDAVPALIGALGNPVSRPLAARLLSGISPVADADRDALLAVRAQAEALPDHKLLAVVDQVLADMGRPVEVVRVAPANVPIAGFFERALTHDELGAAAEVDEVLHALRDGRGLVRQNAAGWLAAHADAGQADKVLARLGPVLRDPDVKVRVAVAGALGAIGGAYAVRLLVGGLADPEAVVRAAVVAALAVIGPDALGDALEAVRADDPPKVQRVFDGLRNVAAGFGKAAVQPLADALQGDRELTALGREVACLMVGDLGADGEDAVPALLVRLRDGNEHVRAAAATALGFIGIEDALVLDDLARLLGDTVPDVRRQAALAAARITGRPLDDRSPAEPRVVPIAGFETEVLTVEPGGALAEGAAAAGIELLVGKLRDGREVVKQNAARALGTLAGHDGIGAAAQAIAYLLRDGDVAVRSAAVHALQALGPEALPAAWLLTSALTDPDDAVRGAVVEALVGLHPEAEPFLIEALRTDTANAERGIFPVWQRVGGRGIDGLVTALHDPSALIRLNAARALERLAKEGAANALAELELRLADPVQNVRAAAQAAIDAIQGGKPRPPVVLEPDPVDIDGFFERVLDDAFLADHTAAFADDAATRLARHMRDGRPYVRANAATVLGHWASIGDVASALPGLAVLAKDTAIEVRVRALAALGRLVDRGVDVSTYGEVLVAGLGDRFKPVREAASQALAALGERAFPSLAMGLAEVDERALPEITALLVALGEPALNALPDALSPLTPELHFGTLRALYAFSREGLAAARAMVEPLAGPGSEPVVREAAVALLDRIDGKDLEPAAAEPQPLPLEGFADALMTREALAEAAAELRFDLLVRALSDGRDVVRANAALGLEVVDSAHELAWPHLVRALKDSDAEVRVRAAEALGAMAPRRDVAFDLVRRLDDPSPRVVAAADKALRAYGEFALDALMYALDDRAEIVGRSVLPMIAGLGEKAIDKLVIAQRYDSAFVRRNALLGLRLLERDVAKAARIAVVQARKDEDREVRLEALRTLDWIDGVEHVFVREPRVLPSEDFAAGPVPLERLKDESAGYDAVALAELLFDGRRAVRENAAAAHGAIGRYHTWLGILLKDSVGAVQVAAAQALQALGMAALPSAPALVAAMLEDEPEVREAAKASLLGFGKRALPVLIEGLWAPADVARKTVVPFIEAVGKDATPAVIAALDHPSQLVVLNALNVLGRLYAKDPAGTVKAMAKVQALVKNPLPAIIGAAQKCLFRLEGRTPAEFQKDPVPMPIVGFDKGPLAVDTLKAEAPALDVAWMISAFADGRPIVRENAARAAGFMPKALKELLIPLTIALKDGVPEVQVAAAEAFANLRAEDATAVPALTFALKNATERVKRACLVALDAYGPERAAKELVKHLVGREDWMLVTIGKVAARAPEVMVPALAGFARREDESLVARENAVRVLGDLGLKARDAEKALVELLPYMEGMLAAKAAFALGRVARPSKELVQAMQKRLEVDPRPSMHHEIRAAVKSLRRRMPPGAA